MFRQHTHVPSTNANRVFRCIFTAVLAGAGTSVALSETYEVDTVVDPRPLSVPKAKIVPHSAALLSATDSIAELRLPPLDMQAVLAQDAQRTAEDKVLRIGIERPLRLDIDAGEWLDLPDGAATWVLDIVAEDALGLRVRFTGAQLPSGTRLVVFSPDDPAQVCGPYTGAGYDGSGLIWADSIFQSRIRIEYYIPAGAVRPAQLPFVIDSVQHYYVNPVALPLGDAGSCHNDVTCFSEFAAAARAVGRMTYNSGGGTALCTGQLITNQAGEQTSLFLTARHCISENSEATSLEVFWLYQTATCNGTPPSLASLPRTSGAVLLSTGGGGADVTLLRLTGAIPNGLAYLGWTTSAPGSASSVCIHHPAGDFKRISFGNQVGSVAPCLTAGTNPVRINWTDAPTEQGSSGSGILVRDTQRLYGVLSCGPSSCNSISEDYFGSFGQAFPALQPFLGGSGTGQIANDDCAAAIDIGGAPSVQGSTAGATGDIRADCAGSADAWWKFTAPGSGMATIDTVGSAFDTTLMLFSACGGSSLACNDDFSNQTLASRVQVSVVAGAQYLIRVAGFNGAQGAVQLNLSLPGGNANANTATGNTNSSTSQNGNRNSGSPGPSPGPSLCPFFGGLLLSCSFAGLLFATRSRKR